jgi:hypothetical protein
MGRLRKSSLRMAGAAMLAGRAGKVNAGRARSSRERRTATRGLARQIPE